MVLLISMVTFVGQMSQVLDFITLLNLQVIQMVDLVVAFVQQFYQSEALLEISIVDPITAVQALCLLGLLLWHGTLGKLKKINKK